MRADDPSGPGHSIGATITTGPNGEVYVAWNDYSADAIVFNRSLDGGATFGTPTAISPKTAPFEIDVPAESGNSDIEGVASYGGTVHAIWTDSRRNQDTAGVCDSRGLMEEVFTATVK